jgi:hypothetical protein
VVYIRVIRHCACVAPVAPLAAVVCDIVFICSATRADPSRPSLETALNGIFGMTPSEWLSLFPRDPCVYQYRQRAYRCTLAATVSLTVAFMIVLTVAFMIGCFSIGAVLTVEEYGRLHRICARVQVCLLMRRSPSWRTTRTLVCDPAWLCKRLTGFKRSSLSVWPWSVVVVVVVVVVCVCVCVCTMRSAE